MLAFLVVFSPSPLTFLLVFLFALTVSHTCAALVSASACIVASVSACAGFSPARVSVRSSGFSLASPLPLVFPLVVPLAL